MAIFLVDRSGSEHASGASSTTEIAQMNKERRLRLREARKLIERAREIVSACAKDEWACLAAMPFRVQIGDRGQQVEVAAEDLYEAAKALNEVGRSIAEAAA